MPEALSVLIVDDDESSREYLGVLHGGSDLPSRAERTRRSATL